MQRDLDRQAVFERRLMDSKYYSSDWFIDDDSLNVLSEAEYRMYEVDCYEVGTEYAEEN